MENLKKILVLENEIEAQLLSGLLEQEGIPFMLKTYHDPAYDGIWQLQKGWGHVEAPESSRELVEKLYDSIHNE